MRRAGKDTKNNKKVILITVQCKTWTRRGIHNGNGLCKRIRTSALVFCLSLENAVQSIKSKACLIKKWLKQIRSY